MSDVVGRFAPSPSGRMHLGNLWACLLAWLAARSAGGRMVLRLEDLDPDRCRPEYCDQILRDLEWLGLDWDGAPVYQSRRTGAYAAAFQTLASQGDPATFDTNQVLQGTAIAHTASTGNITLADAGLYRITYNAVGTNASATGTVGLELQDDGTAIPGSESEATISTTNNLAPLGASVLVNAGAGSVITLTAAEASTTITNASVTVQKLD